MDAIRSDSYWRAGVSDADGFPRLRGNVQVDSVIIGAGITGLTAAMHLARAGRRVAIVEANSIGAGTTGDSTGHLEVLPDPELRKLISDFGEDAVRTVTQQRVQAIDTIESWSRELAIDCDFRRMPAYTFSESADGADRQRADCDTLRRMGLDVSPVSKVQLPLANWGGVCVQHQARFDALRYVRGLASYLRQAGCSIYTHTRAQPPTDGRPCSVQTDDGEIHAENVLVCTHSAYLGVNELDLRVAAYQSYVVAARVNDQVPDALFWDDAEPYHYIRWATSDDPHLILFGGADHKTGQGNDECTAIARLEQYILERFEVEQIRYRWSAEFFEPADGLPLIGRVPFREHVYVATGFSGTGLTFGTAAGELLAQLTLGNEPEWADIVSPSRIKPLAAGSRLLSENLNVVRHFVVDRFQGDSLDSLDEIAVGDGRLIRFRGRQLAVYRDDQGCIHVLSPVCTHAGCHVQWNEFEKTWDCP